MVNHGEGNRDAALGGEDHSLPHFEVRTLGEHTEGRFPYRAIFIGGRPKFLHSQQAEHPQGRVVLWRITGDYKG
eukprot:15881186-Heterocapsa_arctica.AAC.1